MLVFEWRPSALADVTKQRTLAILGHALAGRSAGDQEKLSALAVEAVRDSLAKGVCHLVDVSGIDFGVGEIQLREASPVAFLFAHRQEGNAR